MSRFTGNPAGVRLGLFVLLMVFVACGAGWCTRSDAAEGLSVGFGIATAGTERCFDSMTIAQELDERRWLGFLATHGDSGNCRDDEPIDANILLGVARMVPVGRWRFGFGGGVMEHGDVIVGPASIRDTEAPRVSSRIQLCATIAARRYLFRERVVLDMLHCSSGGSTHYNRGLNIVTLGVRF